MRLRPEIQICINQIVRDARELFEWLKPDSNNALTFDQAKFHAALARLIVFGERLEKPHDQDQH